MPEPQGFRLRNVHPAYVARDDIGDSAQQAGFPGIGQLGLQFEFRIEMIRNGVFLTAGYENQGVDTGLQRLFHSVLDQRLIDDGQHFFGNGLGCRQKTRAETGYRKHCLSDRPLRVHL